jgi:hypothetical protein
MQSSYKNSITFKGGIIMYQISKEIRRSIVDVDVDFIKLSIDDENIIKVFNEIGKAKPNDDFSFSVNKKNIEPLKHEAYQGKRIDLVFKDNEDNTLSLKVDIGVHQHVCVAQSDLLYD